MSNDYNYEQKQNGLNILSEKFCENDLNKQYPIYYLPYNTSGSKPMDIDIEEKQKNPKKTEHKIKCIPHNKNCEKVKMLDKIIIDNVTYFRFKIGKTYGYAKLEELDLLINRIWGKKKN